jgi:nicotinamidase-related amidase
MPNQISKPYTMKDQYTPENSALVLIDHQVGTLTFVHNMSSEESLRNAVMLAKAAKAYDMPVVLTTSQEDHLQGPTAPALQQALPEAYNNRVKRTGIVNAWADPNFSAAVRATGRRKLIMAAVTTDICLIFPAISAVQGGFDVLAVLDASGWLVIRSAGDACTPSDGERRRGPDDNEYRDRRTCAGLEFGSGLRAHSIAHRDRTEEVRG